MPITRKRLFKIKSGKSHTYKKINDALKKKKHNKRSGKKLTFRKNKSSDLSKKTLKVGMKGGNLSQGVIDTPEKYVKDGYRILQSMKNTIKFSTDETRRQTRSGQTPQLPLRDASRFILRLLIGSIGNPSMANLTSNTKSFKVSKSGPSVTPESIAKGFQKVMNTLIDVKDVKIKTKSGETKQASVVETTYGQLLLSKALEIIDKAQPLGWNFKNIDSAVNNYLVNGKGKAKITTIHDFLNEMYRDTYDDAEKKINYGQTFKDSKVIENPQDSTAIIYDLPSEGGVMSGKSSSFVLRDVSDENPEEGTASDVAETTDSAGETLLPEPSELPPPPPSATEGDDAQTETTATEGEGETTETTETEGEGEGAQAETTATQGDDAQAETTETQGDDAQAETTATEGEGEGAQAETTETQGDGDNSTITQFARPRSVSEVSGLTGLSDLSDTTMPTLQRTETQSTLPSVINADDEPEERQEQAPVTQPTATQLQQPLDLQEPPEQQPCPKPKTRKIVVTFEVPIDVTDAIVAAPGDNADELANTNRAIADANE